MLIHTSTVAELALIWRDWVDLPLEDYWKQGDLISFPQHGLLGRSRLVTSYIHSFCNNS